MPAAQQEVIIYKEKTFATAQRQFEKDLKKHQLQGWRVVSVTPTGKKFGRISHITVIYEREEISINQYDNQIVMPNRKDLSPQVAYPLNDFPDEGEEILDENPQVDSPSVWEVIKEELEKRKARLEELERTDPKEAKRQKRISYGCAIIIGIFLFAVLIAGIQEAVQNASLTETSTVAKSDQKLLAANTPAPTKVKSTPTPTPTPTPKPTPTPTPVPYPHFGDGTFVVGKDIQPGTYRTRKASPGCYFERLKGFGGTIDDIIANELTNDPAVVTISADDVGFESKRCGTWTQDLSTITKSQTSFGAGMYIVGTDIQPGTYQSSGHEGCYYARLSGFGGTIDDIIANDNTNTPAIITISADDVGFESKRCGTWKKV